MLEKHWNLKKQFNFIHILYLIYVSLLVRLAHSKFIQLDMAYKWHEFIKAYVLLA